MRILIDYSKREIRLTNERVSHILEHPEMEGLMQAIEETLQSPERVVRSRNDDTAWLYYRNLENTTVGAKCLCVVVKETWVDAFVLTAYLTDKPKQGELLWANE